MTSTQAPKIVKTTTKQTIVQNADGLRHNKEEKVEDLTPGGTGAVTVVSSVNKVFPKFIIVISNYHNLGDIFVVQWHFLLFSLCMFTIFLGHAFCICLCVCRKLKDLRKLFCLI